MKPTNSISLDSVVDEAVPFAFELAFSPRALNREPLLEISPVKLAGEVSRIEKAFAFDATMDYSGRLECSRCLASYPFENSEDFSLVLRKRPPLGSEEIALRGEELDEYFYDDPVVSVEPIAEERIQMAVPMKPLCREDCRGICPRCGQDLNVTACGCVVENDDPRWEALKVLKKV
jgi:DUF177 domain-containing protein